MLCLRRHVQCRGFSCSLGWRSRPELPFRAKQSVWALQEHSLPSLSAVGFRNWSELELEYSRAAELHSQPLLMTTTRKNCNLNCLFVVCLVFVNKWHGGKVGAGVRCVLRLPRRGAFDTRSQGTPCFSSNNEVSERFVGSSLRIVLALLAPFFVPTMCSGGLSLTYQIPLSHAMSSWSLFPDDNPRCTGAKISANGNNLLRVITVIRCPERCDATRSTCVSRDTKSRISNHPWTDIATVTILRVMSKSSELFALCPNCPFRQTMAR